MHKIQCLESGETMNWSLDMILEEINRDRSEQWTPYDETDWLDGWSNWVEGEFYSLI
tara:strand:+ start:546 stop:716 length:171 start_codon:yes stop_codon:yes gene_type:complete